VRVWDPVTRSEIGSFNAYPPGFIGGVFVAAQVPQNALVVDGPRANAVLPGPFTISGWAIAEGPTGSAGVSSVGALAFPLGGPSPIFLGEVALDRPRLDVASIFGGQYAVSGFRIDNVTLAPGSYDLAIGAVNARTRTITQFRVVRVQIR
jgi:hypothetical protein